MKLGEKLRKLREQRQWTQPQAAEAIGIEQSYLSKLENDHSVPSVEIFRRITQTYETNVVDIMDGIDPDTFSHLTQICDIADYLSAEAETRKLWARRMTTLQTIAVALGACLVYAGVSRLFLPAANAPEVAWRNQIVTFVGIFALTYGIIGLLVASARHDRQR